MARQGHPEETGTVKATRAYNLPSRFVFHTVGPIVSGPLAQTHRDTLKDCYTACLDLAEEMGLSSIAFCCISTGEFRFPPEEAASIAIRTVREF
jgi:O-acetyl-ADP-ribose deacetylase (regulator of RNase III)